MEVIVKGHKYLLDNFENPEGEPQKLQFICKEPRGDELVTIFDGTTNEEVLKVLIDRMKHLNHRFPCRENLKTLESLESALMWLHLRTADRQARGVEGKHQE